MDVKGSARAILEAVGGAENVATLQHCSTRLRFSLVDGAKADTDRLRAVPGVLGVVIGPQTQVIVGSKVVEMHPTLAKLTGEADGATAADGRGAGGPRGWSWKRVGNAVMDFVVSVFTPVVPAIAGAGVLKSLLVLSAYSAGSTRRIRAICCSRRSPTRSSRSCRCSSPAPRPGSSRSTGRWRSAPSVSCSSPALRP